MFHKFIFKKPDGIRARETKIRITLVTKRIKAPTRKSPRKKKMSLKKKNRALKKSGVTTATRRVT